MFRTLKDIAVLMRMARALAAYDALLPREYAARVPVSLRVAARLFGSGKRKHAQLSPGRRLAQALEQLGPSAIKLGGSVSTRIRIRPSGSMWQTVQSHPRQRGEPV